MDKNFEYYLNKIVNKQIDNKFVIIIGSGLHKQAFSNDIDTNNCLSSWECLINKLEPNIDLSKNYLLDFERIILNKTNSQDEIAAYKVENEILRDIVNHIKILQSETLKRTNTNYPLDIFNNNLVSDIISLNFDLIPELLLNNHKKTKVQNLSKQKNKKSILHSTRHRVVNDINFWHPHGDIEKYDSLIFGTRKYGLQIKNTEELRKRSKNKNKPDYYKKSWYDVLAHNPVIILGADISDMELDIWNAIVNRERNYGKKENREQHKFPIFQMRELNSDENSNTKSNNNWFKPLFEENLFFDEQWNKLETLLRKIS